MKRVLLAFFFFCLSQVAFSQNNVEALNGYKYAYVENLVYQNNQIDIFGITAYMKSELYRKGLIVLDNNINNWPQEAKENPCLVSDWQSYNTPGSFNSARAGFVVKNCKSQIVYQNNSTASHFGYYFNKNSPLAMEKAFKEIEAFSYHFEEDLSPKIDYPEVEKTTETEESIKNYLDNNQLDPIEGIYKSYQSSELSYYKFAVIKSKGSFKAIIVESDLKQWKSGEVKAYFEYSSMNSIFSVKWLMGNKKPYDSFATLENEGILSIEFKNSATNEKRLEKFVKMYPSIKGNITTGTNSFKTSGSGFFVSTTGIIATNAHVIENSNKIQITITNELGTFSYKAKLLLKDVKNDVALIQIDDPQFKGLTTIPYYLNDKSDIGERVFTIGFPLNSIMGSNFKVTDGIISSKSGISDDIRYFQISVPLQPGNSGGPLFDKDGSIVGITSAKLNSEAVGTSIENVNYAIKISYLLDLLNMLPNVTQLPISTKLAGKELQEQIKTLKKYVCLITVY